MLTRQQGWVCVTIILGAEIAKENKRNWHSMLTEVSIKQLSKSINNLEMRNDMSTLLWKMQSETTETQIQDEIQHAYEPEHHD